MDYKQEPTRISFTIQSSLHSSVMFCAETCQLYTNKER